VLIAQTNSNETMMTEIKMIVMTTQE
jgi:hypothetical protein